MGDKRLYIVHCVDSEGPLRESLEATFERLEDIFGITLEPTAENLRKIQQKQIDFGEKTGVIAEAFSSHLLNYNDSWQKIDAMLSNIMSEGFRRKHTDSFGNGWVYNWFCVDHVYYESNPRNRELGYHKVFDFYRDALKRYGAGKDGLQWHFHPMSVYREAHRCATNYLTSPHIYEVLCRRIIERGHFPAAYRAGFQAERPDGNWFLEQWIPFDYSNWAYNSDATLESQKDLKGGRSGDWRLAPDDWSFYHPSADSWQVPGNSRRWIARCIDILTRGRELTQQEVDKAFARADSGKPAIMACNNHDFRDMAYEVDHIRAKIEKASRKYPQVRYSFSECVDAFRSAVYGDGYKPEPLKLEVTLEKGPGELFLLVETVNGKVFGPQPFLAVETKSGRFIYDNFDFDPSLTRWSYTFDVDSIRPDDVKAIGVAANDEYGNTSIKVLEF